MGAVVEVDVDVGVGHPGVDADALQERPGPMGELKGIGFVAGEVDQSLMLS